MTVTSYNMNRESYDIVNEMMQELNQVSRGGRGLTFLQECTSWPSSFTMPGSMVATCPRPAMRRAHGGRVLRMVAKETDLRAIDI